MFAQTGKYVTTVEATLPHGDKVDKRD